MTSSSHHQAAPNEVVIPYRRPNTLNKIASVSTYYKINTIKKIKTTLLEIGGEDLLQRFIDGPFGHLISWNPGQMSGQALHGIISRSITEPNGLWFHICGKNIEFTYQDYALITGLRFGSSNFDTSAFYDPRNVELYMTFCNGVQTRGDELLKKFSDTKHPIPDQDGDGYIRVAHILMAYIVLFGLDTTKIIPSWMWILVDDIEAWNAFPWGAYTYKILTNYIAKAQDTLAYHFYGPAWALMIWGLEVIPSLGNKTGRLASTKSYPRCLRWGFKTKPNYLEGVKSLDEIFEQEGHVPNNIYADEIELSSVYWTSLNCENPLSVIYVPPTNQLSMGEQFPPEHRLARSCRGVVRESGDESRRGRRGTSHRDVEEVHDTDASDRSKQPHQRRDTRKRPRAEHSSSSSEGEQPHSPSAHDHTIVNELKDYYRKELQAHETCMISNIKASETRILATMKKWIGDIADSFRCSGSCCSPPVMDTRRPSPLISDIPRGSHDQRPRGDAVDDYVPRIGYSADRSLPTFSEPLHKTFPQTAYEPSTIAYTMLGFGQELANLKKSLNTEVGQLRTEIQELRTALQQQQEDVAVSLKDIGLQDDVGSSKRGRECKRHRKQQDNRSRFTKK